MHTHKQAVFIGDVHGRRHWEAVVKAWLEAADLIVFLGDYFDSHDPNMTTGRIETTFRNIIKLKQEYPDKVRLHIGNHDFYYLYNHPAYLGSGYHEEVAPTWRRLLNKHIDLFRYASRFDKTLATHAGLTNWWFGEFKKLYEQRTRQTLTPDNLVPVLNGYLTQKAPDALTDLIATVGMRRGGLAPSGGPFWCDQRELQADPLVGFNQTVGHTPQPGGQYTQTLASGGEWLTFNDLGDALIRQPFVLLYDTVE
jgi:hypothetical protein